MTFTHVIEMKVLIESDHLFASSEGVKIALGIKDDQNILGGFTQSVVDQFQRTIDKYDILQVASVNLQELQNEGSNPELEQQPISTDTEVEPIQDLDESQDYFLGSNNVLIDNLKQSIANSIFSIREEGGRVIKVITSDRFEINDKFVKDLGLGFNKFEQVEIEQDFIIEYYDAENNKKLYMGDNK